MNTPLRCFATATVAGVFTGRHHYQPITGNMKKSFFRFRLVVNEPGRDNPPSMFYCMAWAETADELHRCLEENDRLFVSGTLRMRKFWSDRDQRDWILPTVIVRDYMLIPRALEQFTRKPTATVLDVPDSTVV